ncbi:PREDICTED: uncharacterized protein At4g17910-like [Papilio xuthus]|uniref:Phosphatidylinositol-glycan biosynthesis class W protein n=1 Tax=Papilio xuthus TaxID=66420 RepID=A0AAJ7EIM3_PAPXU|nr:PREDICTED: uncharacterized protein At4g17910-like [Papilio xuthus]
MDNLSYKKYHVTFMENNDGTTVLHTFFRVLLTVQTALLCSIRPMFGEQEQYAYEYVSIILSMIIAHTVFVDQLYVLNFVTFCFIVYEFCSTNSVEDICKALAKLNNISSAKIKTITFLRGLTYLITVFCILAVDFKEFPRYLAKTERYGYSLMDTGVGLFVIMSGLVHKDVSGGNCYSIILSNAKFLIVLISLGLVRFITIKQLDYHEHVTEYGVHWNFFFTLAVCKLVSSFILYYSKKPLLLSSLTLILHEGLLFFGLQDWVFGENDRESLIDANREGIASSLGYVSMYLYAVYIRSIFCNSLVSTYEVLMKFALNVGILWSLSFFINILRPTSRTLANAGFCLYVEAIIITITMVVYFFEVIYQDKERGLSFNVPYTLLAINQNGLLYFLVGNLLTGLININIRTLLVNSFTTFILLNMYMLLTLAFIAYLKTKGVKI